MRNKLIILALFTTMVITSCNLSNSGRGSGPVVPREPQNYTVTYNNNGASGEVTPQTILEGSQLILNANSLTKVGYTFNGWNSDLAGSGTSYADNEEIVMPPSNLELYAQWEEIKPFITTWSITNKLLRLPLDIDGIYKFRINWGDGSPEEIIEAVGALNYLEHTYALDGNYTVKITGICEGFGYQLGLPVENAGKLTDVVQWGSVRFHDKGYQLYNTALTVFTATDKPYTSLLTNMDGFFQSSTTFNGDISAWDTRNVTKMSRTFYTAHLFNRDLNNWKTTKVTDMSRMFYKAYKFNGDISSWDTSNVTKMGNMFAMTKEFNTNISGWDTSNVRDMAYMFNAASKFNQDLIGWKTNNVSNMGLMFCGAKNFNGDISTWNTSRVKNMQSMFSDAAKFNRDISKWNTSLVTSMDRMFYKAKAFNSNISGWNISKVKNMDSMFKSAINFNAGNIDINTWTWDLTNVQSTAGMFTSSPLELTPPSWYVLK